MLPEQKSKIGEKYFAINLYTLKINSVLRFNLYVKKADDYILYRSSDLPFTEKNRKKLLENNIANLYIESDKFTDYHKYVESNLPSLINDPRLTSEAKAGIVYNTALTLVKDILNEPTLSKNIERGTSLVESTVDYIIREKHAFQNMLRMMSFNYYTYTHSVNVCTFSVALAQYAGITDHGELCNLGTGALLHDVGKTRIPDTILGKKGRLTEEEFAIIRKHPAWGVELIRETDILSEDIYIPILQHHERENGSGYPNGIQGNQIHDFSKIVAIADVFDAMTTERAYRSAVESFSALKTMFEETGHFDHRLLELFTKMLGPQRIGVNKPELLKTSPRDQAPS